MRGFKHCGAIVALAAGLAFTGISHAALYDRGSGLIYDDVLNITWLQDANYFRTQADSNPSLVNEIIANVGQIYDTIGQENHTLGRQDFEPYSGLISWYGARAWVENLVYHDIVRNVDYSDWRLANNKPVNGVAFNYNFSNDGTTDVGTNINSPQSELAYMYNVNLALNIGPILNLQSGIYWSDANFLPNNFTYPSSAFSYSFVGSGNQAWDVKNFRHYAWVVRDGDVATVPVPGAIWLFASGLGLLLHKARRKQQS